MLSESALPTIASPLKWAAAASHRVQWERTAFSEMFDSDVRFSEWSGLVAGTVGDESEVHASGRTFEERYRVPGEESRGHGETREAARPEGLRGPSNEEPQPSFSGAPVSSGVGKAVPDRRLMSASLTVRRLDSVAFETRQFVSGFRWSDTAVSMYMSGSDVSLVIRDRSVDARSSRLMREIEALLNVAGMKLSTLRINGQNHRPGESGNPLQYETGA